MSQVKYPFLGDAYSESPDQLRDLSTFSQGAPHTSPVACVKILRKNYSLYICLFLYVLSSMKTGAGLNFFPQLPSTGLVPVLCFPEADVKTGLDMQEIA